MANILCIYGSAYGHTERIARRITDRLTEAGHRVTIQPGNRLPHGFELEGYDGYIIAASVLYGRHQRYIRRLVRRAASLLNLRPSAFVSVSGSAASPDSAEQAHAQEYTDRFLRTTGWRPTVTRRFAGAVAYQQYNPVLRYVMRRISQRLGRPTDTSRNYDFTDWVAVDDFARSLGTLLSGSAPVASRGQSPALSPF